MLLPIASTTVSALDQDGDGTDDNLDACPWAKGNSSVDRLGCPDSDGDGISDWTDRVTVHSSGFIENATSWVGNDDVRDAEFSPNGNWVAFALESGHVRIHNATTKVNVLSRQLSSDSQVLALDWSRDGTMLAATTGDGDDELYVMHSNNLSDIFTHDVNTGGNDDAGDVEFNPNGSMVAYVVGRASTQSGVTGEVVVIDVETETELRSFDPSTVSDEYESVGWSPDGRRLAFSGRGQVFTYSVGGSWTATTTITLHTGNSAPRIYSMDWSPDGNYIAACDAYSQGSGGNSVHVFNATTGSQVWDDTGTSSCESVEFSPDGRVLAVGWYWYQTYGGKIILYDTQTGNEIERLQAPCQNSGSQNSCTVTRGLDWSPDGQWIVSAHSGYSERAIWWRMDPDIDGDGVPNTDDAFPEDGTQWADQDGDGYGDNPSGILPDACPAITGYSTQDRFGCPDSDGDGWSDDNDLYPNDGYQWADADSDGHPDNTYDPRDPNPIGTVDLFPSNPTQWDDYDLDGYGDNYNDASHGSSYGVRPTEWPGILIQDMNPSQIAAVDIFPVDSNQWNDTDGDWIGDEPFTDRSDGCPLNAGRSIWDRLGCPDSDGDGWSDPDASGAASPDGDADAFTTEPSQWHDQDGDSYGDNSSGVTPDRCVASAGDSEWKIVWNETSEQYDTIEWFGCPDNDGDGYANNGEAFPNDPTQWSDRDGDQCGDNASGNGADLFPEDGTQCTDRDGDGYGDSAIGPNGDWFPDDPSQWKDSDGDGYGDNYANESWSDWRNASWPGIYVQYATNPDVCPLNWGDVTSPEARGCPDSDSDGVPDPQDEYPDDAFNQTNRDGDAYADQPGTWMDDCPDDWGESYMGNVYGCRDGDHDGWADSIDAFPDDGTQWMDEDGDLIGDNYSFTMTIMEVNGSNGTYFDARLENGDAFPDDDTQWSDVDGDGHGDNPEGFSSDAFPHQPTQWKDSDGDGYGDNSTRDAFEPDDCKSNHGKSWRDRLGCPDQDGDGMSDQSDPCPKDPEVWEIGTPCAVEQSLEDEALSTRDVAVFAGIAIGLVVMLLLSMILVAMISRQMAKRRLISEKRVFDEQEAAFADEEDRRQLWAEHYASQGDYEKARELGWVEKAQWQVHKEQEEAAALASVPTMGDFDD